jgi:hypothetical protein
MTDGWFAYARRGGGTAVTGDFSTFIDGRRRESRWTRPRPDCPHPERWHAPDAYATETEVTALVAAMVVALQPDFCIETGSWLGTTTRAIGWALRQNGHGELVSLEIDTDKCNAARDLCGNLPTTVLNMSSMTYTPTRPIDFAWFDSQAELRPQEFLRYLPWMHDRTVVGFHDTGPQHPVRDLLAPLETCGVIQPLYLPTPRGAMFARVVPEHAP